MKTASLIRNFCIIAHIDHGKSTLADRFLEITGTIESGKMMDQVLDNMDLERERGITIKSHPIRMEYRYTDGRIYTFNLIDTPGHVDFSYEVSRSLAACEGAILVVDAAQGVEAQTVSNVYLAIEHNLEIIPVINKTDLPSARIEHVRNEIMELIGCDEESILLCSAKKGVGIEPILEKVVEKIPPPLYLPDRPLRALIFDSTFDNFRGAIPYIRVMEGSIEPRQWIKLFAAKNAFEVSEVGIFKLSRIKRNRLVSGDVGYLIGNIKDVKQIKVGDTITTRDNPAEKPLPGYKEIKPMVFSGLYPAFSDDYEDLRSALDKLQLNDASLIFEPETSTALGFGFRCGYLGLLHMEIVQERLEREFDLNLITTVPNVKFKVVKRNGEEVFVDNPTKLPLPGEIEHIYEPYVRAELICPPEYIGNIMKLCQDKRGIYKTTSYLDPQKTQLNYDIPMAEIIIDFYDKLKSTSRGYASLDYEFIGYQPGKLQKLDILISGEPVDALSIIIHESKAFDYGQRLCSKLKDLIPRQLFEVAIQASLGGRIISRSNIKPLRKNVTAKCYGGDITRKRKLLERQREGKRRMKQVGQIEIPQEAFLAILKMET